MTIRKKLIVSNILMILIPALLTLTFAAVIFKTYGNRYWESLEEMYDDKDGVYSAQSIVYAYKEALTDETWVEYVDTDGDGAAGIHFESYEYYGSAGRGIVKTWLPFLGEGRWKDHVQQYHRG